MLNWFDRIMPWLFILCLGFLMVSAGIATAHFNLWPATMYRQWLPDLNALNGAKKRSNRPSAATVSNYVADKSYNGYTLFTKGSSAITLVDMEGKAMHSWRLPFRKVWVPNENAGDKFKMAPYFSFARVFPNGDMLAIYHASTSKDSPYYGMGLVKMNKDSEVIWHYGGHVHDALYVAQNGKIYTLLQKASSERGGMRVEGLKYAQNPRMLDAILILGPDGKEEKQISVIHAFLDTPYEQFLYALGNGRRYTQANSIMLLEEDIADKFPLFKAGDLLLSLRNLDAVAVIRPETGKVVWASRGMWQRPHDVKFTGNGTLMIYDSRGYYDGTSEVRPRILEFDPVTRGVSWVYLFPDAARRDTIFIPGMEQRLPNGNLLATETNEGAVYEITPDNQVVWQFEYAPPVWNAQRVGGDFFEKGFWLRQAE